MELSIEDINSIVEKVLENLEDGKNYKVNEKCSYDFNEDGVFDNIENAIDAAYKAQKVYVEKFSLTKKKAIIENIRRRTLENVEEMTEIVMEETKIGNYKDKLEKNIQIIKHTPGPEDLDTKAISGEYGLMVEEYAPFGLVGAITPMTNPTETIINNTISMISSGNSVVFNVHPKAKKACEYCVKVINKAIKEVGGPRNLITMVKNPTLDTANIISQSEKVRLLVGTGGTGMVNTLLRSGKKTIGAGAGNPPVVVDETADIKLAAKEIFYGASFDNNLLCLAEKVVFAHESNTDKLIEELVNEGAYLLNDSEAKLVLDTVITKDGVINKDFIGQDAFKILNASNIRSNGNEKLLILEAKKNDKIVLLEQLMPVLPIVRCNSFKEAVDAAVIAESGNRHTASIFSKDVNNMTYFARRIETSIYVKNGSTLRGVGIGGEGAITMTIAGPTGEGITTAKSFTRKRRCMLSDGAFRIV